MALILSNGTDSDHDIDIATGICRDTDDNYFMELTSELTKQLDATWAAGDDAGGLFSGSIAVDTWYHVFIIRNDSTGAIDGGFDTSVSAANIPSGYTAYRRIGSVLTDGSSNIIAFHQKSHGIAGGNGIGAHVITELIGCQDGREIVVHAVGAKGPHGFVFRIFESFAFEGSIRDIKNGTTFHVAIPATGILFLIAQCIDGVGKQFTNTCKHATAVVFYRMHTQ